LQVVKAVAGAVPVLVDGGVRRGTDVFKALALGATAVMDSWWGGRCSTGWRRAGRPGRGT